MLLVDTGYSAVQHYHQPIDGDVAWNLVPATEVDPILHDPLGLQTWRTGKTYPNPNRFFCHWGFRSYLLNLPVWLQHFVDPVRSVYLASALAKTAVQLLLLYLLTRSIVGRQVLYALPFLGVALMLVPFFQASGYRSHLGIIDPSITYTFFYALPAALLLLFLLPFADHVYHRRPWKVSVLGCLLLALLGVVVCLSGPLNPGAVLVLTAVAGGYLLRKGPAATVNHLRSLPIALVLLWALMVALSIYSLWIGRYNSLGLVEELPLVERYALLPAGIYRQFTQKLAFPLLFGGLALNYILLRRTRGEAAGRVLSLYTWVILFTGLYLLLLPLGGYREYRPYTLRYDTILPVTLALLLAYGAGSLRLLRTLRGHRRLGYGAVLLLIGLIFTNADRPEFGNNACETAALYTLATSTRDTVPLPADCSVISWTTSSNPADSELNARLLVAWRITPTLKYFYNQEQ
ncbi:hypothetical protein [Neolewinella sp.]|uniref:hypothetical protein n=1 Tax=Neolewinella sp. TaxID=2993543 RepID=UPI003B52EFEF